MVYQSGCQLQGNVLRSCPEIVNDHCLRSNLDNSDITLAKEVAKDEYTLNY